MSSKIIQLYERWGHHSFLFTLICIVWLAWRVSTKPTRISYPCSQFALWQIILFFSPTLIPVIGILHKFVVYVRTREYQKIAGIGLIILFTMSSFNLYNYFKDNQLRIEGSGTIPESSSILTANNSGTEPKVRANFNGFPSTICVDDPVVSFNYNPSIGYGGTSPYDPPDNPAYDFVWETVERLELGNPSSPLDSLIEPGDTVLIKPNWVDFGPAVYTRPEVVRPLIDMAIAAGATEIYVGDGAVNVPQTNSVMDAAGYSDMVSELDSRHPGITIETVNLNALSNGWHWVRLDTDSSFAGSGYSHYDLAAGGETLFGNMYYSTPDPQGISPGGDVLGWYAVSDKVLGADVIINVPKMKTHQIMMATMSIKNLVGCTISSTYDEGSGDTQSRIPHHKTDMEVNYFNNDIFWRAILDMNKIILYADENGVLQPSQQRMYLNVVDGIQAMERSQHDEYGGGGVPYDRNVVLAGVDPVAVDAVGCRVMGYDFSEVPSIANADSDTVHPIGTSDPENIVIIGEAIDSEIDHVFEFNSAWSPYAGALAINDFIPPAIISVNRQGNTVTADISGGLAAYIHYQMDGTEYIEKMSKDNDTYSAVIPDTVSGYWILAQDDYFNTVLSEQGIDWSVEMCDSILARYTPETFGSWGYAKGLALEGMWRVYQRTGNIAYYNFIKDWVNRFVSSSGLDGSISLNSLDNMMPGVLLCHLYQVTGDDKYKTAADQIRDRLDTYDRTSDGGLMHRTYEPYVGQLWLDGVFMISIFLINYGEVFDDAAYCNNESTNQLIIYNNRLEHSAKKLAWHAWDEDGSAGWADPATHLSPEVWCRALGWYVVTCVEILEKLPLDHPDRQTIIDVLVDRLQGIEDYQDSTTGLWYQVVDKGNLTDNWVEESSGCMYTYAMSKAMELGYVTSDDYYATAKKGYEGILSNIELDDTGKTNIYGTCVGTGVGDYAYYIDRDQSFNDNHGQGAFLFANEQQRTKYTDLLQLYQAENATLYHAATETINKGFTGASYVNLDDEVGSYVQVTVNAASARINTLTIRYANGSPVDMPMKITVNGIVVHNNLAFYPTGAFRCWKSQDISVSLNAGDNTIVLESVNSTGGPHIDWIAVDATSVPGNTPPTAPVVNVTPDSPTTSDDLVCSITTPSTDPDVGDEITYSYAWYKDDVHQPGSDDLTIIPAASTANGETWRCVVTPNDGTSDGSTGEDEVIIAASVCPGDANSDGIINVLDMTRVARIILLMDPETPGADANQDGVVNVLDITKLARIILQLDPYPCP